MPTSAQQNAQVLRRFPANSQFPNGPTESSAPTSGSPIFLSITHKTGTAPQGCACSLSTDHKLIVLQKIRFSAGKPEPVRVDVRFQKPGFVAGQDLCAKRLPFRILDRMLCRQKRQLHRVNRLAVQNVCFQRIEPHERLLPGIGMAQRITAVFKFPDVRQIIKAQSPDGEILRDRPSRDRSSPARPASPD